MPRVNQILIMGVAGSGKSTIGSMLAKDMDAEFVEGDEYHSSENLQIMRDGIGLNDTQRKIWITRICKELAVLKQNRKSYVLSCSALRHEHRKIILKNAPTIKIVFLKIRKVAVKNRVKKRSGHFFPETLVDGQFEALEVPRRAISIESTRPVFLCLKKIKTNLRLNSK